LLLHEEIFNGSDWIGAWTSQKKHMNFSEEENPTLQEIEILVLCTGKFY
jgi:hypothetical protein